ncbi:hypothetical protein D3C83_292730 [compost metagenome]
MLASNAAAISPWHWPQVSGTRSRATDESGSVAGRISWAPWQLEQVAPPSPLSTASAWTLAR